MVHRPEQLATFLKKEVGLFLERSVSRPVGVLISVTHVDLVSNQTTARISISIYPEEKGAAIFNTLKPYEAEARGYLSRKIKHRNIPFIIFLHDTGQDSRVRLEKLLENMEDK